MAYINSPLFYLLVLSVCTSFKPLLDLLGGDFQLYLRHDSFGVFWSTTLTQCWIVGSILKYTINKTNIYSHNYRNFNVFNRCTSGGCYGILFRTTKYLIQETNIADFTATMYNINFGSIHPTPRWKISLM